MRLRWAGSPTEQQAGEHRLHNNEFLSTAQPARLLICGRGWLRDNANALCAAQQLLYKRILLPWQERDEEAWVVIEGQFMQHEKKRGFILLQRENKEAIMDESVQNQRRSEITLYSSNGVGPSVRQKHSYIHVRQLSRCSCVFSSFSRTALRQMSRESPEECWPSFPQILQILGHVERSERIIACKGCSALAVWLPETETVTLKLFLSFNGLPLQWYTYVLVIPHAVLSARSHLMQSGHSCKFIQMSPSCFSLKYSTKNISIMTPGVF